MNLELRQIVRAEVETLQLPKPTKRKTTTKIAFTDLYTILFELSPSGGIFESRVLYNRFNETFQVNNDILRINLYGQTSACIQDKYELRSFCYCISYHKKYKSMQTSASLLTNTVASQTSDQKYLS